MEFLFVSSWAHGNETGGVGQYRFDPETGEMVYIKTLNQDKSCNVSLVDEKRGILYVLNESAHLNTMRAGGGGEILAYQLDKLTGDFTLMDSKPTFCANPAQLALDKTGEYMVVAHHATSACVTTIQQDQDGNYRPVVLFDDAVIELLEIHPDGSFGRILDVVKHTGEGPEKRQTHAHPHSATMSPSGNLFAVCDKGNDTIRLYRIDRERKRLECCCGSVSVPPGSMPRFCVFHPTKPWLYHNNENSAEIHVYRYEENGKLERKGVYCSLQADQMTCTPVEQQGLCMDKTGRFLYSVLRGPNQIAVFSVDQTDGTLTLLQNQAIKYEAPRGAALSPNGKFLVVSCLKGEKVVVLRVGEDGKLLPTGYEYHHPCASHITFWRTWT